ncbi:MAG: hypothetical protein AAF547_06490 [Actinomycetota bacterium]
MTSRQAFIALFLSLLLGLASIPVQVHDPIAGLVMLLAAVAGSGVALIWLVSTP